MSCKTYIGKKKNTYIFICRYVNTLRVHSAKPPAALHLSKVKETVIMQRNSIISSIFNMYTNLPYIRHILRRLQVQDVLWTPAILFRIGLGSASTREEEFVINVVSIDSFEGMRDIDQKKF